MEQIYTSKEVAQMLKFNVQNIWKLIREGKLKASGKARVYRISESQLKEYMENR
jgi:excisionase family DNA binding protein